MSEYIWLFIGARIYSLIIIRIFIMLWSKLQTSVSLVYFIHIYVHLTLIVHWERSLTNGWTEWQCHFLSCSSQLKSTLHTAPNNKQILKFWPEKKYCIWNQHFIELYLSWVTDTEFLLLLLRAKISKIFAISPPINYGILWYFML